MSRYDLGCIHQTATLFTTNLEMPSLSPPPTRLSLQQTAVHISVTCRVLRLAHATPQLAVLSHSIQHNVINALNTTLRSKRPLTSHQLYDWNQTLSAVQHILRESCGEDGRSNQRNVYDVLHDTLQRFPASHLPFDVLSNLWRDALSVLRAQISTWLAFGTVEDPKGHFFIDCSEQNPRVIDKRLPCFISPASAQKILFAGNARKCTLRLTDPIEKTEVSRSTPPDWHKQALQQFESLLNNPICASLSMEAAAHHWRTSAVDHLSQVLPFDQIRARIESLRQYLLLGDALFWRTFFDELRATPFLSRDRNTPPQVTEKGLNHILKSITTDLLPDDTDAPLYIRVTSDYELVPVFVLSFAEGQVLRARSAVYGDVFSIVFSVRRVACELRAAFQALMALQRPLRRCVNQSAFRSLQAAMVPVFELRRRMAEFIDGMEWYLQAEVIEPKFTGIARVFNEGNGQRREPFFDVVCRLHDELMTRIFDECFVNDVQINARLEQIFGVCSDVCEYIEALTQEALGEVEHEEFMKAVEMEFSRNVGLLLRMLLHIEKGHADSKIPALVVRINFNRYLSSEL